MNAKLVAILLLYLFMWTYIHRIKLYIEKQNGFMVICFLELHSNSVYQTILLTITLNINSISKNLKYSKNVM